MADDLDVQLAFERRFRSPDALAAARLFGEQAREAGLLPRARNNAITALEFEDDAGAAPVSMIANDAHALVYLRQPALASSPGLFQRAVDRFGEVAPNKKGEYRWRVHNINEMERVLEWLRSERVLGRSNAKRVPKLRRDGRLPAAVLDQVDTHHLREAAADLAAGFTDHDFSEVTKYEVVVGSQRIKPKALFGVAATRALGFKVLPGHFSGGLGTQCFRKIEGAGFTIVDTGALGESSGIGESVTPTKFDVGGLYSRDDVAEVISMPEPRRGGNWDTGYDKFNGEYFIFCNIGVAGRTGHNYANRWHDGRLIWFAKGSTRLNQPQVQDLLSGRSPVHLFWRGKDRAPFSYAGLVTAEAVQDTSPIEVTWIIETRKDPAARATSTALPLWRRGPPPSIGERMIHKQDGPTSVYLMVLDGACNKTFPTLPDGSKLAKIGMSNDPSRRLIELNSGIPPGCILQWAFLRAREYSSGPEAYAAEGELLEQFRAAGKWLGNEFVSVTDQELADLLT